MPIEKKRAARLAGFSRICLIGAAAALALPVTSASANPSQTQVGAELYSPDEDAYFAQPYIDVDEWRDAPVRHRYIHGGFKGTDTRFSFYFPPKEQYEGRFFQSHTPVPISENLAQAAPVDRDNPIAFSADSGAYYVETNGGGAFDLGKIATSDYDSTISAYRAAAASAAYSRIVAQEVYGTTNRPYGYAFGGSGGAYRTIGSFENTTGVWDGVVPLVMGSNMAIPNMFTFRIRALRTVGNKLANVTDAAEPGGSDDIYEGLSPVETDALREATHMGFPPQTWFGWRTMGIHGLSALYPGILAADPTYFTDFWTKPGYLGHDDPDQFEGARLQFTSTVENTLTAAEAVRARININASNEQDVGGVDAAFKIPEGAEGQRIAGFRLAETPPGVPFLGGDLIVNTGAAKGQRLPVARIVGDVAVLGTADADIANQIQPGDEVVVDNSNFLALETYHRHQVPPLSEGYDVWNQFRKFDGSPLYPQRPFLVGPEFVKATGGSILTGDWKGKMIVVEALWDREALPWQADWYREQVREYQGEKTDQNFRLWYVDHAMHGGVEDASRNVSYGPVFQQALRDVAAWAEAGVAPPKSSTYRIVNGQVIVASTAEERMSVQPVVSLTVNGGERAVVEVGEPVTFTGTIEVPPNAGAVVGAEWDFEGTGNFSNTSSVPKGDARVTVSETHIFDKPGTYFSGLRGASQRDGDADTPYARIENLGRVRVIVR